jgi:hypothetical protein
MAASIDTDPLFTSSIPRDKREKAFALKTDLLTELSPSWEAANCAAIQEIPSIIYIS